MIRPRIFSVSPNRANIKYVVQPATNIEEAFEPLAEEVKCKRVEMGRVIIFCRTYDNCSHIYMFLRDCLGKEGVQPIGAPDLAELRLVDMFTACTHPPVKEKILSNF